MGLTSVSSPRIPGLAVASLVLGIVAFIVPVLGILAAILALVFGVKAKNRIDASRGALSGNGIAISGIVCGAVGLAVALAGLFFIAAISIPGYIGFQIAAKESTLESNMRAVEIAVEKFGAQSGHYPATINTTVRQVLADLGQESDDERSVADAGRRDPASQEDLNSTGSAFLSITLKNGWNDDPSSLVIATWSGEPEWSDEMKGVVWYVPNGVDGNRAAGYQIYGASEWELYEEVLSSD